MDINELLAMMTRHGASDLHLKPRRPPLLRLNGKLLPLKADPVTIEDMDQMVTQILTPIQKRKLEDNMAVDLGYGVPGVARFRGNVFMQRGHLAACFRRIPYEIKSIDELSLPKVIYDFCKLNMGLVLITGPTGSGKSTTLAGMVKYVTNNRHVHLITIEDPMEFLFSDGLASISQRELGTDTNSFAEALRNAMRQDPDVIMVGEMRDPVTIQTVITAAETGHLVFSTLHTNTATQTIDRILDSFPADQQSQVRAQLAQVLRAVVSMKLVARKDGQGRVAALEVMRNSPKIANLIEKGKTADLHEELESSVGYYRMQSMNHSLLALLVHGVITYHEAMEQSGDPEDLSLKLRKMFPNLAQEGDDVSESDFAEIHELREYRRLYEEQEEKTKMLLAEKGQEIAKVQAVVGSRDEHIRQLEGRIEEMKQEAERMRGDFARLKEEAQQKIDKLMERVRDLNQRMQTSPAAPAVEKKSGLFR
ncbi:MAG TPA: PilT/PilU family type 4a pilus ATPase [Thermoanaerobaculia bacterium]|jgi:twitching motility protein PilT